jgi:hypothetical protein
MALFCGFRLISEASNVSSHPFGQIPLYCVETLGLLMHKPKSLPTHSYLFWHDFSRISFSNLDSQGHISTDLARSRIRLGGNSIEVNGLELPLPYLKCLLENATLSRSQPSHRSKIKKQKPQNMAPSRLFRLTRPVF